jgi:hypothetical protein
MKVRNGKGVVLISKIKTNDNCNDDRGQQISDNPSADFFVRLCYSAINVDVTLN